ncbi:uncharacterized protein LOC117183115 isoform X2 [Belonocnema kinseyi]|uniref:uncharacterized protein LOC117183115 isoform X2 n=1 Tax=Belonocnema kinseyi TaxID=2817044 RepID=UPI00143DE9B9|nr:uncharacterized protein LOC117183115 isoform X2 [Belonocnema kinseyi]
MYRSAQRITRSQIGDPARIFHIHQHCKTLIVGKTEKNPKLIRKVLPRDPLDNRSWTIIILLGDWIGKDQGNEKYNAVVILDLGNRRSIPDTTAGLTNHQGGAVQGPALPRDMGHRVLHKSYRNWAGRFPASQLHKRNEEDM